MKLSAKVKGGLAWTGLFVILAVPAADLLFGKSGDDSANLAITSDARQVAPAAATAPAATRPATDPIQTSSTESEPVQRLLAKGKKLPSYISDADEVEPPRPAAVQPVVPVAAKPPVAVTAKPPIEVASLAPAAETPPVPMPRDARPHKPVAATTPGGEQPLIIDENAVAQRGAPADPFPLSDGDASGGGDVVTGDQLEEWNSGSLADYLARKGLLSDNQSQPQASDGNDADGFYLDQGSNRVRRVSPADTFFLF